MRAFSFSLVAFAALAALPYFSGDYLAFQLSLYLIYALAAVGVGLCWGQAGFLPLGQAAFFGIAAYLSATALLHFTDLPHLVPWLAAAAFVPGLLAFIIGLAVFRKAGESGAYFSMITLALSLLASQVATTWGSVTGGYNGLNNIPALPGLDEYKDQYYLALAALAFGLGIGGWLLSSPIGVLWRAIAQNERRVVLLGFNTNRMKAVAFGLSAFLAGVAGMLYAPQQGLVIPQQAGFELSADLVIWAAVGGRARLWGPALGAVLIGVLTAQLRDSVSFWEILMAAFFMVMVLVFPGGLAGPVVYLNRRFSKPSAPRVPLKAPSRQASESAPVLKIEGVTAGFGPFAILNDLSLEIDRGGICCIIGPNGAGKTSAFNMLTGEMPVRAGRVTLDGLDMVGRSSNRIAQLGIGRKLQVPSVFPSLSIEDNLCVALWSSRASWLDLLRPSRRRWTSPMLEEMRRRFPFLANGQRAAAELSLGQRQILELTMAFLSEPRVLLLDEPAAGLSTEETSAVVDVIRWAGSNLGGVIVIVEHDMSLVRELAETVYVLKGGSLLAQGNVKEVRANPLVRAVYLGAEK